MALRVRLVLLFLAAGIVPLSVTLLILAPRGEAALHTSAKLLHQAEVESLRAQIDGAFDDLLADVHLLAARELSDGDPAERRALMRFLLEKHQELTVVTLWQDGHKVPGGQAFDRAQMTDAELLAHDDKARALVGSRVAASDFYASARRGEMLITLVAPLRTGEQRLAAEVSLRRVQDLVAKTRIGRQGIAYVVDEKGRLVAHPDRQRALKREDFSSVPVVKQLLASLTAPRSLTLVTDFSDEGKEQVGAFVPLGRLRWGVVVSEPRADAYGLARATWAHAAGWSALSILMALLVALYLARNITRPVKRLAEGTKVLATGAFGVVVPVEGPPEIKELARLFNDASQKLDQFDAENRKLMLAVERGYVEILRALVNAIEAKDPYTAGHSQRTAELAVAIGRALQLGPEQLHEIEIGGLLHDIGKIGIAEQILRKPAQLDDAEMRIMRGHPAIGDAIVADIEMLGRIRSMVRNHHERWDGSGYPDGLRGEEIPLAARIIAVADTYDAITSDRCYQPGRPPIESIPILRRLAGQQLDADAVQALFVALVELQQLTREDLELAPAGADPPSQRRRPTLEIAVPPKRSDAN
jgi:HD-GYP domain-containing protein (c-di-GMP phosphodiesterase class II)